MAGFARGGPERSAERDAALVAILPLVATRGWGMAALMEAAGPDADLLFPGGPADMVEAYCDLADRWMEEDAASQDLGAMRVHERIRAVIGCRLARNAPYKEAVRRGLGVLSVPGRGGLATRCTARTVDAAWHAAGDEAADFSWYTKRLILTGIYGSTLLFWLKDDSRDGEATMAFLDRRLSGVAQLGRIRRRFGG